MRKETDSGKIDVAVNAPEAGTIREFLVSEEDTVTVGQDIAKLELGGQPVQNEEAKQVPKAPASKDQSTPSDPEPENGKSESKDDQSDASVSKTEATESESRKKKAEASPPKQESPPAMPSSRKPEAKVANTEGSLGNREERRVGSE